MQPGAARLVTTAWQPAAHSRARRWSSSGRPCHSSNALSRPMRREPPPASTTPITLGVSCMSASDHGQVAGGARVMPMQPVAGFLAQHQAVQTPR